MADSDSSNPGSRRALVTGATGFVGGHLLRRLIGDGWVVHALVRDPSAALPDGVALHAIPAPIDELIALVASIRPQVCFHLATAFRCVHVPEDIEPMVTANVGFGTALAEAVSQAGDCIFVNTGTVWQHYDARPYSPVSLYAAMKQAFTDVLRFYQEVAGLPVVTLELTDTYGPGDPRPKLLPILLRAAREGTQLQMTDGTQLIDVIHVDDAVSALVATAAGAPGATYGASSGETLTIRELVARFEKVSGLEVSAEWGVRAARPREMTRPWMVSGPPPGWAPTVSLDAGIRALVGA
ncbi:MAG: NAD-dependent epimerase/dehydratase family protein [Acidimicrobiia bacterium]